MFEVDFSYRLPEFGLIEVDADDAEHAETVGLQTVREMYPDVEDIKIEAVREI